MCDKTAVSLCCSGLQCCDETLCLRWLSGLGWTQARQLLDMDMQGTFNTLAENVVAKLTHAGYKHKESFKAQHLPISWP